MPPQNQKKGLFRFLDKIFMGIIVGGAVGSVIGMTMAPKKGKETRELLKEKGKEAYAFGKKIVQEPNASKETHTTAQSGRIDSPTFSRSFFGFFRKKVHGMKNDWKVSREELRRIPHENIDEFDEIES
ncbi:YtxH domain-containing protein [Candidatus Peregrinibacteria bacterium]|nr:YtxH domain-containing protein [Candidatus Peregrinibacteria bacterium]